MSEPFVGQKVKLYIYEKKKDIETEVTEIIDLEGKTLVKLKSGALVSWDVVKKIPQEVEEKEKENN
jgi:hypothetical protein